MESILTSIKKPLGISEECESFDAELIIHINSTLSTLTQLGVGPSKGFFIKDKTDTWADFIGDVEYLEFVKSYIYLKVRLIFDPPLNSSVLESMKNMASEYEWRINAAVDPGNTEEEEGEIQNGE